MFMDGYNPKRAMQDVLVWIAYRVNNPEVEVTDQLHNAECRLQDLNPGELLDAVGMALRSGIKPGLPTAGSTVKDPFEKRGRF